MENKKVFEQEFVLPLFNVEYSVVVLPSLNDGLNYMREIFNNIIDVKILEDLTSKEVCIFSVSNVERSGIYILFFKDLITKNRGIARVVYHHTYHLSIEIMDHLRMDVDISTSQLQAYILEELTDNVLKSVRQGISFIEDNENNFGDSDDLDL